MQSSTLPSRNHGAFRLPALGMWPSVGLERRVPQATEACGRGKERRP